MNKPSNACEPMAIPPPRLDDFPDEPDEQPLEENVFVIGGYSIQYLRPFKVVDERSRRRCRIAVDWDIERRVAPQWADNLQDAPPGAVQDEGTVKITFAPAVPGRIYRLETSSGSERKRYNGPKVPARTLPRGPIPMFTPVKEFLDEVNLVRLGIAVGVLLILLAGAGYGLYRLLT